MATKKKTIRKNKSGWRKVSNGFDYLFTAGRAKQYRLKKLEFIGFREHPTKLSLYSTGGGFNSRQSKKIAGDTLLRHLSNKYKRTIHLKIYKNDKQRPIFKITTRSISIKISLLAFIKIIANLGNSIELQKSRLIDSRINEYLPNRARTDSLDVRLPRNALSDIKVNGLHKDDHKSIFQFIDRYVANYKDSEELKELQTEFMIKGNKETLTNVINKFQTRLYNKSFNETKWQKFLHTEVFPFLSNYQESIRETDVNTGQEKYGEKKPDFVWIDIYGFLDVFEIKTPHTDILAKRIDGSHDNYYLSSDASKAISQIEKYILFLERNVEKYKKYMERLTSMPFSVIKPKAYLIIGNSKGYNRNEKKKEDFRLIRRSLKNIEIITFNELLDNLKGIESKMEMEE